MRPQTDSILAALGDLPAPAGGGIVSSSDPSLRRMSALGKASRIESLPPNSGSECRVARPSTPSPVRLALTAALLFCLCLCLDAPAAFAGEGHVFSATFGDAQPTSATNVQDPYPLSGPSRLDLDQATGDVYVSDPGHYRIEKFNSDGEFLLMFGGEVDATTHGDICPEHPGDLCQPGLPAPPTPACGQFKGCPPVPALPGEFNRPVAIAVDNSCAEHRPALTGAACQALDPSAGDLYVADDRTRLIQKFEPDGALVAAWRSGGTLGGPNPEEGGGEWWALGPDGIAVGPKGELYVNFQSTYVIDFSQNGTYLKEPSEFAEVPFQETTAEEGRSASQFKVDPTGAYFYTISNPHGVFEPNRLGTLLRTLNYLHGPEELRQLPLTEARPTTGFAFDLSDGSIFQNLAEGTGAEPHPAEIERVSPNCEPHAAPCPPAEVFGVGHLQGSRAIAVSAAAADTVYAANPAQGDVEVFRDVRPAVTTGPPTASTETSATLSATVDPEANGEDHGPITECRLEYGLTVSYGHSAPCQPDPQTGAFSTATPVTATATGLTPASELPFGSEYHYRFLASNQAGATGAGLDRTFKPAGPPRLLGLSSSHLTATSAELDASVDPGGLATRYAFEYGTSTEYGQTVHGELSGSLAELSSVRSIAVHLQNLQRGLTYHFRLSLENDASATLIVSEDHTFEFFPPSCPNAIVRQQTGTTYLPDCRAYELVSPANANGTLLYAAGPTSPTATNPSRFSFSGAYSTLPGTTDNIGGVADLYVATRTATGWESNYVGPPSTATGCAAGPPNDPWSYATHAEKLQDRVLSTPSLDRILDFDLGAGYRCYLAGNGTSDASNQLDLPSNAPYLWSAGGAPLGRLPSDIEASPAALASLECSIPDLRTSYTYCTGDVAASPDLGHFVFSSNSHSFAPGGLTAPPGSAYDDDLQTGTITLVSDLPGGQSIPQDPSYSSTPPQKQAGRIVAPGGPEEFIRFPAVSTNGSHILMSTATARTAFCDKTNTEPPCPRFTDTPLHLYMSIDDKPAIEISKSEITGENVAVDYLDMLPDGSRVYFTSPRQLTSEDHDTSADLYMWSQKGEEEGRPLTLISKAAPTSPPGAGNSDSCEPVEVQQYDAHAEPTSKAPWTAKCGVQAYSGWTYANAPGGLGGNGASDSAIASQSGDVYFFSPEQLDGNRGVPNGFNLYGYRNGELHYVATFAAQKPCGSIGIRTHYCASSPIARFQVTPDGSRLAFLTQTQLTPYDNASHLEMYSYTPATEQIVCDSCRPDGQPPTGDVYASENGRFLTDDGRVFFSTPEPLAPQDTNEAIDVYEFVEGRPQLITPGTGAVQNTGSQAENPGLVGVSADGTDVYIATFDTFISEDLNGAFLKFYDARSNGGFPHETPSQPCAAAEECHGPGTEAPLPPGSGTAAPLAGGNLTPGSHHKKHRRARHKRHHHRAAHNQGAPR